MVDIVQVVLIYKNNLRLGMQQETIVNIISLNFNLLLLNSNIIYQLIHKSIIKTHFTSLEILLTGELMYV